jgi:Rrf2 family protein
MILSQSAEYAMRSVIHLAGGSRDTYAGVGEISEATGVPASYLAKVLGHLVRAGVLESSRGPSGGFRLGPDAANLTLERIIGVFDRVETRRCLLGSGICGDNPSCAIHKLWAPVAVPLREFLTTTTIADLSRSTSPSVGGVQ